jgi:UDP-2,3-diacylglucosamine hydrolase
VAIERLVIVADAHLGGVPADVEAAFLEFLDAVPSLGDGLLINGDLFAFWFAYRRAIPREGVAVLARLAALARVLPVAMTGGNHDRWGDTFWEQELGIRFSPDELRIPLATGWALAVHGDGVAEARWHGRLLHSVFRHSITSGIYRLLHPDFGFWLVDRFAGRLADSTRDPAVLAAAAARQRAWAEARLRAAPEVTLLIMGHTHRPALAEVAPGRWYLNPGAWMDGLSYATAGGGTVELRRFRE